MKIFSIFYILLLGTFCSLGQALTNDQPIVLSKLVYNKLDKQGVQNAGGKPLTPPVYERLEQVSKEFFIAYRENNAGIPQCGVISVSGKIVIPFNYDIIKYSQEQFIVGEISGSIMKYGVVTESNNLIIAPDFNRITPFGKDQFGAQRKGKTLVFDKQGNIVAHINIDSAASNTLLTNSFIPVYKFGKIGLLDSELREVVSTQYKSIEVEGGNIIKKPFSKWQLLNTELKSVAAFQYDSIFAWNNNLVVSVNNDKWVVNLSDSIISNAYHKIECWDDQVALTVKNNVYGVINAKGEEVLEEGFEKIVYDKPFFHVKTSNRKEASWSLYDMYGIIRTQFKYDSILRHSNELFPVKRKGKWGVINRAGVEVIRCTFDKIYPFINGVARVAYYGEEGLIDTKGNWVLKPRSHTIQWYGDSTYIARDLRLSYLNTFKGNYIYFTENGLSIENNQLVEHYGDSIVNYLDFQGQFSNKQDDYKPIKRTPSKTLYLEKREDYIRIKRDGKFGFIDVLGNLRVANRYEDAQPFHEGLAAIKIKDKWGIIDKQERLVVQPQYDSIMNFRNGKASAKKNGLWGMLASDGAAIVKYQYDKFERHESDYIMMEQNGKLGLLDTYGAFMLHAKYDALEIVSDKVIIARNGKYGVTSLKGVSLLPQIYSYIAFDKFQGQLVVKE